MKNDFILLISLGILGLPFIQPSDTKPILKNNIPNKQISINGLFEYFNNLPGGGGSE